MTTSEPKKRKIILHVGFHKTGSSSIQESFSKLKMDGIEYAKWGPGSNHSGVFLYAFKQDKLQIYGAGGKPGALAALQERSDTLRVALAEVLSASTAPVLMFSAEELGSARNADAVKAFKAFLDPFASEFQVIGYVRPHAELFVSAFQQRLKMGTADSLIAPTRPGTGAKMLLEVFGKEAVTLVPFDRSILTGGDVVLDLAHRIGVAIQPSDVVRANESLSEEALGVLACHFAHGKHRMDFPEAVAVQMRLQAVMSRFGSTKFRLSGPLIQANLDQLAGDVAWVKDNLGIVSVVPEGEGGIGSIEALRQVGAAQLHQLTAFVAAEIGPGRKAEAKLTNVVSLVDSLTRMLRGLRLSRADHATAPPDQVEVATLERQVAVCVDTLKDALRRTVIAERQSRATDQVIAWLKRALWSGRSAAVSPTVAQPGFEA